MNNFKKAAIKRVYACKQATQKLTVEQALEIYSDDRMGVVIAAEYRITPQLVSAIRKGKAWKNITEKGNG